MKSRIAILLACLFLLTAVAGCAQSAAPSSQTSSGGNSSQPGNTPSSSESDSNLLEGPFPLVKEKVTLTFMRQDSPYYGNWDDMDLVKTLEEKTNVHIEMLSVATDAYDEKFNLAVNTGDLPDVFFPGISTVSKQEELGNNKIIIPLEELFPAYGPHIQKRLEETPIHKKTVTALDGHIYDPGSIVKTMTQGSYKTYINMDFLDAAGMEMPKTIDELTDYLRWCKSNGYIGLAEYYSSPYMTAWDGTALAWFGETVSPGNVLVNVKNGKVSFISLSEGWRAYHSWIKSLIDEGLTSPNLVTQTEEEILAHCNESKVGLSTYLTRSGTPQDYLQVLAPVTSSINSKQSAPPVINYNVGGFVITKACENPELAVKWFDLFYRNEDEAVDGFYGNAIWIGQQGVDWDYTDSSKQAFEYLFENKDDLSSWLTFLKYHGIGSAAPGYIWHNAGPDDPYMEWVASGNRDNYYPFMDADSALPSGVRFTSEESDEISSIETDLGNTMLEFRAKYLSGQASDSDWATYEQQVKQIGVERYLEILQGAYDRFMNG